MNPIKTKGIFFFTFFLSFVGLCQADSANVAINVHYFDNIPTTEQVLKDYELNDPIDSQARQIAALGVFNDILFPIMIGLPRTKFNPPITDGEKQKINALAQNFKLAWNGLAINKNSVCNGDKACLAKRDAKTESYKTDEFQTEILNNYNIHESLKELFFKEKRSKEINIQVIKNRPAPPLSNPLSPPELPEPPATFWALEVIAFLGSSVLAILLFLKYKKLRNVEIRKPSILRYALTLVAIVWAAYVYINWSAHKFDLTYTTALGEKITPPTPMGFILPIALLFLTWIKVAKIPPIILTHEVILTPFGKITDERRISIDRLFDAKNTNVSAKHSYFDINNRKIEFEANRNLATINGRECFALRVLYHLFNEKVITVDQFQIYGLAIITGENTGMLTCGIDGTPSFHIPPNFNTPADILSSLLKSLNFLTVGAVIDYVIGKFIEHAQLPNAPASYRELIAAHGLGHIQPADNIGGYGAAAN